MRFDWTDLRIFLHVCEAGSMTAAAARCHLTLAAVSARIRSLEASTGVVLLERQARGVAPTPAGEVLAAHARVVFDQLLRLQRDLQDAGGRLPEAAVVLANSSALARPLPDAVAQVQAVHGTPIVVRESESQATVQALRLGAAEVGIVSDAVDTGGLVAEDLGPDPLVLVVPRAHALAGRPAVSFRESLGHPWVALGEQSALSAHLQLRALALGQRIDARVSYPTLDGALRLVGSGRGVTVLPGAVVPEPPAAAGWACIALDEAWAQRRLLVCRGPGGGPLRTALVQRISRCWRGERDRPASPTADPLDDDSQPTERL